MRSNSVLLLTATSLLVTACSSPPRNFAPVLSAVPASEEAYQAQFSACQQDIAAGTNRRSDRAASAVGGAAAGAGASLAAGAAASGTYATMGGAMAALGATVIAAPIALIAGAWGISKIKKSQKERAIKTAMAECLADAGYSVADFRVMSKREVRSLAGVAPAPTWMDDAGEQAELLRPREQ